MDTESKIIHFMGSNKYTITKIKCWPVFKQDPNNLVYYYKIGGISSDAERVQIKVFHFIYVH